MGPFRRGLLVSLLPIGLASVSAQDRQIDPATPNAAIRASTSATLTGKERLGRKWMDEQRIDNCNVPIEKRGIAPRSNTCSHASTNR
jgi:hypothetical protein